MATITLATVEAKITAYSNAIDAVLAGQSYSIAGRTVTRANLKDLEAGLDFWVRKEQALTSSTGNMRVLGIQKQG